MSSENPIRRRPFLSLTRISAYARIFLVVELGMAVFLTAGTYGLIKPLPHAVSTDFVSFYAAGYLANHGPATDVYNQTLHHHAENLVKNTDSLDYNYFFYPPPFILICSVLARFPYIFGFLIFEITTLFAYGYTILRIVRDRRYLLPFIAFPAVFWCFGFGQNGLLSAALLAGGTLLVDTQPILAGILFGCLIYKPHFGLLIPVALIAGYHWRAFFAAGITALLLIGLTVLLYGVGIWRAYLGSAISAQQVFEQGRVAFSGLVSPFAAIRLTGGAPALAYALQIVITLLLAFFVAWVWQKKLSLPVRAAALTASVMPAVPVVLFYDFTIAAVAIAWMTRLGRGRGFKTVEIVVYCAVGLTTIYARGLGMRYGAPLGPFALAALVAVVFVRSREEFVLNKANCLNAA